MWETAVKRHEDALIEKGIEKGMLLDKQSVLIDQFTIRFGKNASVERKIRSVTNTYKLDLALRKILTAKTKQEILACLN